MRRRDLPWLLFGAQAAPAQPQPAGELHAAKERVRANSQELNRYSIPMATEPAFAFKA